MKIQRDTHSCGVFAIVNALRALGKKMPMKRVRAHTSTTRKHGTTEHGLKNALERLGYGGTDMYEADDQRAWERLTEHLATGWPVILCVDRQEHWVAAIGQLGNRVLVFDSENNPKNTAESGLHVYDRAGLLKRWTTAVNGTRYGLNITQ